MKKPVSLLLFGILLLLNFQTNAADGYVTISPPQPTQTGNKIEVLEVFWYACPHCYDFEPYIKDWLVNKADDVEFRRMPGVFAKTWVPHGKAFFTAQKLGMLDIIHTPLFDAEHKNGRRALDDEAIADLFVKYGANKEAFKKIYHSEEIDTKVKQAYVVAQRYKITSVPALVVNGKYLVSGNTAGDFSDILKVVDQLVDKERAVLQIGQSR